MRTSATYALWWFLFFFEPTDVIVSSKPFETNYWKAVKFITPNTNELQYIARKLKIPCDKLNKVEDIAEIAGELVEYIDNVIVTLGPKGGLVARKAAAIEPFLNESLSKNVEIRHYPAEKIDGIANVSGAGDSFASGLIISMLQGLSEEVCISVGFAAAREALRSSKTVAKEMFDRDHPSWKKQAKYIAV